jgi:hypothetical protein
MDSDYEQLLRGRIYGADPEHPGPKPGRHYAELVGGPLRRRGGQRGSLAEQRYLRHVDVRAHMMRPGRMPPPSGTAPGDEPWPMWAEPDRYQPLDAPVGREPVAMVPR